MRECNKSDYFLQRISKTVVRRSSTVLVIVLVLVVVGLIVLGGKRLEKAGRIENEHVQERRGEDTPDTFFFYGATVSRTVSASE
jgi:hypothetical protein